MDSLLAGIQRFQRDVYPQKNDLFGELDGGQKPETLFITCSDSRIVPSLITSTEPGELFVIRNAGNIVPPVDQGGGEAATIEYAVEVLQVKDIVVCGHSRCGAMAALLDPVSCNGLSAVGTWIKPGRQMVDRLRESHQGITDDDLLALAIRENVIAQLETLGKHPSVQKAVAANSLNLHGWVYSIASGSIDIFDSQQRTFNPLTTEAPTA